MMRSKVTTMMGALIVSLQLGSVRAQGDVVKTLEAPRTAEAVRSSEPDRYRVDDPQSFEEPIRPADGYTIYDWIFSDFAVEVSDAGTGAGTLLPNGDFETDMDGWSGSGGCTCGWGCRWMDGHVRWIRCGGPSCNLVSPTFIAGDFLSFDLLQSWCGYSKLKISGLAEILHINDLGLPPQGAKSTAFCHTGGGSCEPDCQHFAELDWKNITIDISQLKGEEIYFVFENYGCSDGGACNMWMGIDNVKTGLLPVITDPVVSTLPATNIGRTSGTLRGRVDHDGGEACTYRFSYRKQGGTYANTGWSCCARTADEFSALVSDLAPGSVYEFRAEVVTMDTKGRSQGHWRTFTTFPPQRTLTISSTPGGSVVKPGEGSFQYDHGALVWVEAEPDTHWEFVEWTGTAVDAGKVAEPGSASTTVTVDADYTLRANFAVSGPAKPTVATQPAASVGETSAALRGIIENDGGEACQFRFRYRSEAGGANTYTEWTGSVRTGQSFSQVISGLEPGTTYYFAAGARNSAGESNWGTERSFATNQSHLRVATESAIDVTASSATLRGRIEEDGGEACQYRFRYKGAGGLYKYTSWTGSRRAGQWFQQNLSSLSHGTRYYFNARARNSAGNSDWGNERSFTTQSRPVVTEIRSNHCSSRKHSYYLDGVSLNERFTVTVDWKGRIPGTVKWATPTYTYRDQCPGTTVSRSFDMGSRFRTGGRLKVVATSADATESYAKEANFDVIPPPPGIPAVSLRAATSGSQISYSGQWLLDAIDEGVGAGVIDDAIPGFGGRAFDFVIRPMVSTTVRGDGSASATMLRGYTLPSMSIAGVSVAPSASVELGWTYSSTRGLWLPTGKIQVRVQGSYTSPPSYFVIMVGPIPVPHYWRIGLEAMLDVELALTDWYSDGTPKWHGRIPFDLGVEGMLGVGVADVLAVEGYLRGSASMLLEYPHSEPLRRLCIGLDGGITVYLLFLPFEVPLIRDQWCLLESHGLAGALTSLALGNIGVEDFELADREYLGSDYAVWVPRQAIFEKATGDSSVLESPYLVEGEPDDERLLQSNVFPRSAPAIAADGNDLLLAWIYDDPNRTSANRTKILFSSCLNGEWTGPTAIDDDGTADFSPQFAILPSGDALCVWANASHQLSDDVSVTGMAATMDIAVAHYDPFSGVWSSNILTNDYHLDRTPRIAAADDGTAMVAWIHNESDDVLGVDAGALNEVRYSLWDGSVWRAPSVAAGGLGSLVKTTFAYNGDQAVYICTIDEDRDWGTDFDRELYAIVYDGVDWSEPNRLTNDDLFDANPQVVYDGNGLLLVWYRDGHLVSCRNLDVNGAHEVLSAAKFSGAMDFRLARNETGQISLVWTDMSPDGVDIFVAVYDSRLSVWSNPYTLTSDQSMEQSLAPTYLGVDELAIAYNKVEIEDSNGVPTPGRVDLCVLRHQIRSDLAIAPSDISLSIDNPLPGTVVDISAVIHNVGDVAEVNVPVSFYNGRPEAGGRLIGAVQEVSGPIQPAGSITASASWPVPEVSEPQQVYVIVDPECILEDADRSNNGAAISVMAADLSTLYIMSEKIGHKMRGLTARVTNTGVLPVEDASVTIRKSSASGPELASFEIAQLDPNSYYDVHYDWDVAAEDFNTVEVPLYVLVDEPNAINESDEYNNTTFGVVQVGRTTDITDDGQTHFDDLAIITDNWLTNLPSADIAPRGGDDTVNFLDFALLAQDWLW